MPPTVIYANILPFLGLLCLMILVRVNPLFDRKQNKMFFQSALLLFIMLAVISLDYICSKSEFEYGWLIRRITSFFNFACSCVVPIILIRIYINRKINRLLYLPAIINMIICAVSIFFNLVFYLPKEGGYERGPLFFTPFLISIFYIVILLALTFKKRHEHTNEALFLVATVLALSCAMYLEVVERYKFLSWDFASVGLIIYYLLLNINRSKIDSMTGAYNRAMYTQKIGVYNHSRPCIIALMDINDFKSINDQKGHEEGDKILIQFVKTMKLHMDKRNTLYRIGGDEFVVISEEISIETFKKRMEICFLQLGEQGIYCAVGIEKYNPAEEIEATIRKTDQKMYEDKRRYYANKTRINI